MPVQFFESIIGQRFYEHQLPALTSALNRIADALTPNHVPEACLENVPDPKFFRKLMDGNWDPYGELCHPSTDKYRTKCETVRDLEDQLRDILGSDSYALLDQYADALLDRLPDELENAFLVGYQTAVKLLLMGITPIKDQITPKKED